MRSWRYTYLAVAISVCLAAFAGCSSGGDSAPATTATVPLTDVELAAFNDFVDNGALLNQNGRRCLATPFMRAFGIEKLRSFGAGVPLSQAEAETTYEEFKKCFDPVGVFDIYYPQGRTTEQTRCVHENGPSESTAKGLLVGLFRGTKMSLSDEARAKVQQAVAKCTGGT